MTTKKETTLGLIAFTTLSAIIAGVIWGSAKVLNVVLGPQNLNLINSNLTLETLLLVLVIFQLWMVFNRLNYLEGRLGKKIEDHQKPPGQDEN